MKKVPGIFKNKYIISSLFVLFYILIMHDSDIFTLLKRTEKVSGLEDDIGRRNLEIADLKLELNDLDNVRTIEKYGREEHLFKKEDEDIFIFSFE